MLNLNIRVGGCVGNTAMVSSVFSHVDVSSISPRVAPAVLDDPVAVTAPLSTVSYSEDCMVEL